MNAIGRMPQGDPDAGPEPFGGFGDAPRGRHLRSLEELVELGMALARALAGQALAEVAAAEASARANDTSVLPVPADPMRIQDARGAPADGLDSVTAGRDMSDPPPGGRHMSDPPPGGRRWTDPSLGFARVSRAVCQAIALEARIAAGEIGAPPRRPGATARDLGLGVIREVLRTAAAAEADTGERIRLFADIRERLNAIAADAADEPPAADIIASTCDQLGLALDRDALPADVFYLLRNEAPRVLRGSGGPDPP